MVIHCPDYGKSFYCEIPAMQHECPVSGSPNAERLPSTIIIEDVSKDTETRVRPDNVA